MSPGDRVALLVAPNSRNRLRRTRPGTVLEVGMHGARVHFDDEAECPPDRWSIPRFLSPLLRLIEGGRK